MKSKKIKVSRRFIPMFENLESHPDTIFVIGNGDLGYLKRLEKIISDETGPGNLEIEFSKDTRIGAIKTSGRIKKKKQTKRVFEFL